MLLPLNDLCRMSRRIEARIWVEDCTAEEREYRHKFSCWRQNDHIASEPLFRLQELFPANREEFPTNREWLHHQPQSALTRWFKERVDRDDGSLHTTTIVALARKLLVALWKYGGRHPYRRGRDGDSLTHTNVNNRNSPGLFPSWQIWVDEPMTIMA